MNITEVHELSKTYPSFRLSDVSFTVAPGRITGLAGRNGAGKTTAIKAMLNLIHPDSGGIYYFGKALAENEREIKQHIGYSTGAVSWYPRRKIRDVAGICKQFYSTWNEAAYQKYLAFFALDEDKTAPELSEGMRVKYNLLLALSHDAKILILDEPTSGLDPFSRNELLDIFTHLKQSGTAILFSTHIISDLEKCADDIVYLSKGRVMAALPKTDFIARFSTPGESLEDTLLRLEGGVLNA